MMSIRRRFLLALSLTLPACATTGAVGDFVWVDQYQDAPVPGEESYVIAPGDLIDVRVFQQEQMSARARVRSDGRVSLPFLNDVDAAGYTPAALAQQLQTRLRDFVNNPVVTVSLEEAKTTSISVLGEVVKPGLYPLEQGAGVLQALASAGGMSPYAKKERIFVLRQGGKPVRIRFTYVGLVRGGRSAAFRLRDGDVVVVE